jgi:ribonuclease HII
VVAAAVILPERHRIQGLNDSKQLDPAERDRLDRQIRERAVAIATGSADTSEIDRINILQASRLAMLRAVQALSVEPDYLLIDAVTLDLPLPQKALIKGDARCQSIAAASIVAKVHRDRWMAEFDERFPEYGLRSNKGYGTPAHLQALERLGPTPLHRRSFIPVAQYTLFS